MADGRTAASVVHTDPVAMAAERDRMAREAISSSTDAPAGFSLQVFSGIQYTVPYTLKVVGDSSQRPTMEAILKEGFELTNTILNNFNPDSEVSRINKLPAGQPHVMSPTLQHVLRVANLVNVTSGGLFDVAVTPAASYLRNYITTHKGTELANLFKNKEVAAKLNELEAYSRFVQAFDVDWKTGTITKKVAEATMDLGGCSKGYCLDDVVAKLKAKGYTRCLFEWGGDVKGIGKAPNGDWWKIGIMCPPPLSELTSFDPKAQRLLRVVDIMNDAIATSGDYYQVLPGTNLTPTYNLTTHTFVQATEQDLAQVSVRAKQALFADCCATAGLLKRRYFAARGFLESLRYGKYNVNDFTLYVREQGRMIRMFDIATETPELKEQRLAAALPCKVVVVGGGLAGLCAAIEAAHCGAAVILIDKETKLGGNSAKATSGINGWGTEVQGQNDVIDNGKFFERDTFLSGVGGYCDKGLVKMLSVKSSEAIHWLMKTFQLPLDVLYQLGGHSKPRTHRVPDKSDGTPVPVGYTIIQALINYVQQKLKGRVAIMSSTEVTSLLHRSDVEEDGVPRVRVYGVTYRAKDSDLQLELVADSVVLTTGGFGNDLTQRSLLKEFAPQLVGTATTNGPWTTGDGVKMGREIGARLVDMDKIQLHPTGFIDPKDPTNNTKFLGPEALRGSGGILVNTKGKRFVNELDLRSKVSAAIHAQGDMYPSSACQFAYCILNQAAIKKFGPGQVGFYKDKLGLFQDAKDVKELAKLIGCDEGALYTTLEEYEASCKSGYCTATTKRVFPSVLGPVGPFIVAAVTPSIHYCMGGLLISPSAEVQMDGDIRTSFGRASRPVLGLFAAGEVTGGVHGENRLGGNSLLECVVFGRIAGDRAATVVQRKDRALSSEWTTVVVREVREGGEYGFGSVVIRFNLPGARQLSGIAVGQFVAIKGEFDGQELVGYYSPITLPNDYGVIGLLARVDKGNLKDWLRALQPGDAVQMKAAGGIVIDRNPAIPAMLYKGVHLSGIIMIAGGTGVAPMLQIIRAAIKAPYYSTIQSLNLIYAAETVEELTYTDLLNRMSSRFEKLKCQFVLNNPPPGWVRGVGFIDQDTLREHVPMPSPNQLIVLCGPPVMQRMVRTMLSRLGHPESMIRNVDGSDTTQGKL
eukprot:PhF_6_TR23304/c1_g1_i1/m.32886